MKIKKIIPVLLILPLVGCFGKKNGKNDTPKQKEPLVIPNVDVDNLSVNLPSLPARNEGAIRNDGEFDYLDFYEVSDFHGAVNYKPSSSSDTAYIGLQKLATYFDTKRENNPGGTFILSSGDMFQGSAESNLTRGYLVNYSMQYMGFDAMALGNHEFDWTDTWIKKNAALKYGENTIPYLGANIVDKTTGEVPSFLNKSTIIERNGYKIGVIGTIGNDLSKSILASCLANYEFKEEGDIVSAEAASLRSQGCNAVVWLAHQGLDNITSAYGVDAVFGGHAHENKEKALDANVCAVATKNYGQGIGHISLKFDAASKTLIGTESHEVDVIKKADMESVGNNSDIKNIMDQYAVEIDKIKDIKLATTSKDLMLDGALKGICCKSIFDRAVKAVKANNYNIPENKIIASFHNVKGGIRDNILAGDITYGSVYTSFPFDNEIVLLKLSGSQIKAKSSTLDSMGNYHTFEDIDKLDSMASYYVVTTDFCATSTEYFKKAGGFTTIEEKDLIRTNEVVRDTVAEFIYDLDVVNDKDFLDKTEFFPISNSL